MSLRQPPALAAWLLDRLGYTRQNAALAGDLLEEYRSGRSPAWFWRQTLMVIVNGIGRNAVVLQSYLKAIWWRRRRAELLLRKYITLTEQRVEARPSGQGAPAASPGSGGRGRR